MNNNSKLDPLLFLALLLALAGDALAAGDRALFWEVRSPTATVYLLGSIHVADDSFYPMRPAILREFDASDKLIVEVDISRIDAAEYMDMLNRYSVYQGEETIRDHVSARTYETLQQVLAGMQLSPRRLERRKPGFLTMDLITTALMRQGYSADKGIDIHFIERAYARGKPVVELETLQQQMGMFASLPHGEVLLLETLNEIEHAESEMRRLVDAWKAGDLPALTRMFITEPEQRHETYRQLNEILLYERNARMTARIRGYLAADETCFVIVGAGHLIGERGIVNMLREAGFSVERR